MVGEELHAAPYLGGRRTAGGADAHLPGGLLLDLHAGEGQAALRVKNVLGAAMQLRAEAEAHEFEALHQFPGAARGQLRGCGRAGPGAAARAARRAARGAYSCSGLLIGRIVTGRVKKAGNWGNTV